MMIKREWTENAKSLLTPERATSPSDGRDAIELVFASNISINDKVLALDKIYACNLKLREDKYREMCNFLSGFVQNIKMVKDPKEADSIVENIAWREFGDGRSRFVFSSKFCYFTHGKDDGLFFIYDQFVDRALNFLIAGDAVRKYEKNYSDFANKMRELLFEAENERIPYRDMDGYLWLTGQVLSKDKTRSYPSRKHNYYPSRVDYFDETRGKENIREMLGLM